MKYLLDTHALIWLLEASLKVSAEIRENLKFPGNLTFLSAASLWEIA